MSETKAIARAFSIVEAAESVTRLRAELRDAQKAHRAKARIAIGHHGHMIGHYEKQPVPDGWYVAERPDFMAHIGFVYILPVGVERSEVSSEPCWKVKDFNEDGSRAECEYCAESGAMLAPIAKLKGKLSGALRTLDARVRRAT